MVRKGRYDESSNSDRDEVSIRTSLGGEMV
jgi:hypothetical protein